jgi:hypothetical protein
LGIALALSLVPLIHGEWPLYAARSAVRSGDVSPSASNALERVEAVYAASYQHVRFAGHEWVAAPAGPMTCDPALPPLLRAELAQNRGDQVARLGYLKTALKEAREQGYPQDAIGAIEQAISTSEK